MTPLQPPRPALSRACGSLPDTVRPLVRGWIHGNVVVVVDPARPERVDVVDTGYGTGLAELAAALPAPARRLALTHVHADHAGGAAALQALGAEVHAHADAAALVARWDRRGLWLEGTGQALDPFAVNVPLGGAVRLGGRPWQVIHTPGHATGGVSFFDPNDRVLITGDALWEDGFGLLDPWVDGEQVMDEAATALDRLARVDARWVIPGHGPPFTDLVGALARARARLAHLSRHRDRLQAQVVRNGLGFFRLAHPDAEPAAVEAVARSLAATHDVSASRISEILTETAPRPPRGP